MQPGWSRPLYNVGQNQRWPTSGEGGYITRAAWVVPNALQRGAEAGKVATYPLPPGGVPTISDRGAEEEVAHKWATWLHNPCRLGGPHRFRAGVGIRGGPQVGNVAT